MATRLHRVRTYLTRMFRERSLGERAWHREATVNNPFGRSARLHLSLAFVAVVVITLSGCATSPDQRRLLLPPPPSEDLRSQLGRVRLSEGGMQTAALITAPAKGAGEGAARGAGLGAWYTIAGGSFGGPSGFIFGILLAPVGALVGAVVGAARAEPAARVEEKEAAFRVAMDGLKVPETFSRCVADRFHERTSTPGGRVSSDEPATTILEVVVEQFGLDGSGLEINPSLSFVLTERTRLIRASNGTELYGHWLTYRGRPRPLDDWVSRNHARLREETERACHELAERLVDEVFLVYLPRVEGGEAR